MKKAMMLGLAVGVGALAMGMTGCRGGGTRAERMEKVVDWKVEDALDELDATADQRTKVEALKKKVLAEARPMLEQGQGTREALADQWRAVTPDAMKAHQVVDAQVERMRAFAHTLTDAALEVHALLTPEQRAKVTERLDKARR